MACATYSDNSLQPFNAKCKLLSNTGITIYGALSNVEQSKKIVTFSIDDRKIEMTKPGDDFVLPEWFRDGKIVALDLDKNMVTPL